MNTPIRVAALLAAAALLSSAVLAEEPTISDPDGRLIADFDMPGEFPTSVTAANINITPLAGVEFDGAGENFLQVEFPSAGPIAWTESRHNGGDFALLIGPADPQDARYYPPASVVDDYQALNDDAAPIDPSTTPTELTTLAWRVSNQTGALFATPRRNVYLNDATQGYTLGGTPVGNLYGVAYFGDTLGQGWGFRMQDGVFANGSGDNADLIVGAAGAAGDRHEASLDVATVYLPYEEGWQGAWVNSGENGEATFAYGAPGLEPSAVNWSGGSAAIALPGVDSATDGMLFVAPANDSSTTRLAAAFPNGAGGWTANVRLDEDADTTGQTVLTSGNNFQFLYVPYDANDLIGGHVDGDDGSLINSAGDAQFDLSRNAEGDYVLTVLEADGVTKKTGDDGMLMLSVAGSIPTDGALADRTFLSYEYDATGEAFVIQSRELLATSGGSEDIFGNDIALRDSDFYFAWVDFTTPLSLSTAPPLEGDYNNDGVVDAADYTVWRDGNSPDSTQAGYDLWRANYGAANAASASSAAPEPASALLLLLAASGASLARRRG